MEISCPSLFDSKIYVNRKVRRAICRQLGCLLIFQIKKNARQWLDFQKSHDILQEFFRSSGCLWYTVAGIFEEHMSKNMSIPLITSKSF
jgi:hypothetical protein